MHGAGASVVRDADGGDDAESGTTADSQQAAPKTIQASPGDVASSRPVTEPANQKQQNQS